MKHTGIYRIRNSINGHFYIGSSKDIKNRWRQHCYDLNHNQHSSQYLQNAWNKYGKDAFIFEIVEECACIKKALISREQYYIDTLTPEYNIEQIAYSSLGIKRSEETKKKISEAKRNPSEETRKRMSEAAKKRPSPNKGKAMTAEQKSKLSKAHKGKKLAEATIEKMKNKILSEEHKKNIGLGCQKHFTDAELELLKLKLDEGLSIRKISKSFVYSRDTLARMIKRAKEKGQL